MPKAAKSASARADQPRDWKLYLGVRRPHDGIGRLPPPPSWRPYRADAPEERKWPANARDDAALGPAMQERGRKFHATKHVLEMVNAALYLRRPLLVTGAAGSGKTSLVDAVAYELRLGEPLRWSVTSRSNLREALYQYDAITHLQKRQVQPNAAAPEQDLGDAITLGPLGTALLPTARPRALLIDEIDKGDVDLPNDLLNVFEEGAFDIPELLRLGENRKVQVNTSDKTQLKAHVTGGRMACREFPLMVLTSNGERDFPAPFLRRCLRLRMPNPTGQDEKFDDNMNWQRLDKIIDLHFSSETRQAAEDVIANFKARAGKVSVATDQLLNAIHFVMSSQLAPGSAERNDVVVALTHELLGSAG